MGRNYRGRNLEPNEPGDPGFDPWKPIRFKSRKEHLQFFGMWDYEREDMDSRRRRQSRSEVNGPSPCLRRCIIMSVLLLFILVPVVLYQCLWKTNDAGSLVVAELETPCADQCRLSLVESLPEGINLTASHPSTYETWARLIESAQHSIEITSFYWTLRSADVYPDPSSQQGETIFTALLAAGTERNISVRIVQSLASKAAPNTDTEYLVARGAAEVRDVDVRRLMGGGVLHSKMWLVDRTHVYVGSANMDWRSLTQVKEMGAVLYNCSCLAADMAKLFEVYWYLGHPDAVLPPAWPAALATPYNIAAPMNLTLNGSASLVYIASSPPPFCPSGRSNDVDAILDVIQSAEKFVYVAVMDYFPLMIYGKSPKYWPVIDDALRTAAVDRRVNVRLLASHWNHTRPALAFFLRSLSELTASYPGVLVEVKLFRVPATPEQARIPYGRVNHNKYMVTDRVAYIGTSNWSGDYFVNTAGIGLVMREEGIRAQLEAVFRRDWESPYAETLAEYGEKSDSV